MSFFQEALNAFNFLFQSPQVVEVLLVVLLALVHSALR